MLLPLAFIANHVLADPDLPEAAEELVVTGTRTGPERDSARSVTVLDAGAIAAAPVTSVAELLSYAAGVDLRPRGMQGVQADVSLRGASFEQTLVLLDGVKVVDPQTGHQSLNVPVTLADIERLEVLRGSAARLYGPNAFGGVINIITRRPRSKGASVSVVAGEHALVGATLSGSAAGDAGGVRFSIAPNSTEGYRHNTAAQQLLATLAASVDVAGGELSLLSGFGGKEFGANGFYSASFPEAWEATKVGFAALSGAWTVGEVALVPRLSYRQHRDEFLLDHTNPAFYRNEHTTETFGAELQATTSSVLGVTAIVGELGTESIDSTRLGNHSRSRGGVLVEHRLPPLGGLELVGGAAVYGHSGYGLGVWPGADLTLALGRGLRLYASANEGFRVPTFTELYYDSPTDHGDPELKPERAWTYEGGVGFHEGPLQARGGVFLRHGRELIDWVRASSTERWQATNLGRLDTRGAELEVVLAPRALVPVLPLERVRASYTWLDSSGGTPGMSSKYVLDNLRHQASLELVHPWPGGARQSWIVRLEDRVGAPAVAIVDAKVAWRLERVELSLQVTNLGDVGYAGAGYVTMPGRWLSGGLRVDSGE